MPKDLVKIGSNTAKMGFQNEKDVIDIFNDWKNNKTAQEWLMVMNYKINEIEYVKAVKVSGHYKADVQVQIKIVIKLKEEIDVQNISVKLVSQKRGYNQIDKRWVKDYNILWDIPEDVEKLLKHFTGELEPKIKNSRDNRRMFIDEFSKDEQSLFLSFFVKNKMLIVSDILKGRGEFSAEWFLVILKDADTVKWSLKPINYALNFFGGENIEISKQGSLKIGKITMQRKGGDGGRKTANMLQFKIDPSEIMD